MPDSTETSGKCLEDVDSSHSRKPGSHQHSADVDDELTHVDRCHLDLSQFSVKVQLSLKPWT